MKKRIYPQKLALNKNTVANLTQEDMVFLRAGGDPTDIGETCYTGPCCRTNDCQAPTTNGGRLMASIKSPCTNPHFC